MKYTMSYKGIFLRKAKSLILVFVHHMMSVNIPWRNTHKTSKACKTLVNQSVITMLQIEVKCWVDETGVDETGVDKTGVDKMVVDDIKMLTRRNNSRWTRMLPFKHILIVCKLVQAQMAESIMTESCKGGYICSSKVLSCMSDFDSEGAEKFLFALPCL